MRAHDPKRQTGAHQDKQRHGNAPEPLLKLRNLLSGGQCSRGPQYPGCKAKQGDSDDEEADDDAKVAPVDVPLKEAKRILADLIDLWQSNTAVAKSSAVPVTRGLE